MPVRCGKCKSAYWKTGSGARQTHQTAGVDKGLPEPSIMQVSNPASPTVKSMKMAEILAVKAVKATSRQHDTKTCRVYRCGLCASYKEG